MPASEGRLDSALSVASFSALGMFLSSDMVNVKVTVVFWGDQGKEELQG